jgi:hypothetical protein
VVLPKNAQHLAARELGPTTTQISVRPAQVQPRPAVMTLPSGRQAMNIPATSSLY